jgi:hypothetical protein
MEMSSLLALNVDDRAICDFLVGLPVQRDSDRKVAPLIASNDLDAAHGLAPGPLSNGLQALFSESSIAQSDCLAFRHGIWPGQQTSARSAVHPCRAGTFSCGQKSKHLCEYAPMVSRFKSADLHVTTGPAVGALGVAAAEDGPRIANKLGGEGKKFAPHLRSQKLTRPRRCGTGALLCAMFGLAGIGGPFIRRLRPCPLRLASPRSRGQRQAHRHTHLQRDPLHRWRNYRVAGASRATQA